MVRVHLVAGARPNFVKVAPLYRELAQRSWCEPRFVHTGQHRDPAMSTVFVDELGLPDPDVTLDVGPGSQAEQTAAVLVAYERVCLAERPDWVVVVGDVTSTLAAALAARKLNIPVAHLEAGLRSGDETMPEEVNRRLVDVMSALLWTHSPDADLALAREGVAADRIERVGNIMIDSLVLLRPRIDERAAAAGLGLAGAPYVLATLHRPATVDGTDELDRAVAALAALAARVPVVLPLHPRTTDRLRALGRWDRIESIAGLRLLPPLPYITFVSLLATASLVVTDSGGVQEEATYLRVPCATMRTTTERPITLSEGSNRLLAWPDLPGALEDALAGTWPLGGPPALWDGSTARRCADSLERRGAPIGAR